MDFCFFILWLIWISVIFIFNIWHYIFRIITTKAVRSIGPLFKSELKGPFITWSEYPANHLDLLYKRWINFNFKFSCPEEQVRAAFNLHVKRRYNDWMSEIRNSVFKIHHTAAARYANHPSFLNPEIWIKMVDKWLKDEWQVINLSTNNIYLNYFFIVCVTITMLWMKFVERKQEKCHKSWKVDNCAHNWFSSYGEVYEGGGISWNY